MKKQNTSALIRWYIKHKTEFFVVLDTLFRILSCVIPQKNIILLESKPDFSDNTGELFRYMIENNVNSAYNIVWLVDDYGNGPCQMPPNVSTFPIHPKSIKDKIKLRYMLSLATCIICSHRFVFPYYKRRKQVFVYLDHGSPLKDCKNIYQSIFSKDVFYVAQSDFFVDTIIDQYGIAREHIVSLGLPRNDQLFNSAMNLEVVINSFSSYEKVVIWAPTFRYHASDNRVDCHSDMPLGIPICYSKEDLVNFNDYLKEMNVLVILKPHPAQNIELIVDLHCSNIKILYSDDLIEAGIQTNELLAQMDALITDYSSIYYDYLLLEKPIAITLDDYEQYKDEMGFVFENPLNVLKGDYIYDMQDLYTFIGSVLDERDNSKEERERVLKLIDQYRDPFSTKRVFDFIASKGVF